MGEDYPGAAHLPSIFANLGRAIRGPLDALQGGISGLLDDAGPPPTEAERAQAATLLALCEDLRQLTIATLGSTDGGGAGADATPETGPAPGRASGGEAS